MDVSMFCQISRDSVSVLPWWMQSLASEHLFDLGKAGFTITMHGANSYAFWKL